MKTDLHAVEELMLTLCRGQEFKPSLLEAAVSSHMAAGGGRVRAAICLDASLRLGVPEHDALHLAAICELLHNASLVQDDMLDRTTTRRGAASLWFQYSDTLAVCAGDLMLSAAYRAASLLSNSAPVREVLARMHRAVALAIHGEVHEGQPFVFRDNVLHDYEHRARAKSASLLSLCLELPLLLAGHHHLMAEIDDLVGEFAAAYQMADDLADVLADEAEGSLNAVLILEQGNTLDRETARHIVSRRAIALLASATARASRLPADCALRLIEHAEKLKSHLEVEPLSPALGVR